MFPAWAGVILCILNARWKHNGVPCVGRGDPDSFRSVKFFIMCSLRGQG